MPTTTIHGRAIRTEWQSNPIRNCCWSAVTEDYDLDAPIGYGGTEAEAIANLIEQVEEGIEDAFAAARATKRLAAAIQKISIRANSPDGSRAAMDRHLTEIMDICAEVIGDVRTYG